MKKNYKLLILMMFTSTSFAQAWHSISITNNTSNDVTLNVVDSKCMYNTGASPLVIPKNTTQTTSIQDKNPTFNSCWDAKKTLTWETSNQNQQIQWIHRDMNAYWNTGVWPGYNPSSGSGPIFNVSVICGDAQVYCLVDSLNSDNPPAYDQGNSETYITLSNP